MTTSIINVKYCATLLFCGHWFQILHIVTTLLFCRIVESNFPSDMIIFKVQTRGRQLVVLLFLLMFVGRFSRKVQHA